MSRIEFVDPASICLMLPMDASLGWLRACALCALFAMVLSVMALCVLHLSTLRLPLTACLFCGSICRYCCNWTLLGALDYGHGNGQCGDSMHLKHGDEEKRMCLCWKSQGGPPAVVNQCNRQGQWMVSYLNISFREPKLCCIGVAK